MKKIILTNLIALLTLLGLASCEPEVITETEFVDRIIEVPGETIIETNEVTTYITEYGDISFSSQINDTIVGGGDVLLGQLKIEGYAGFEVSEFWTITKGEFWKEEDLFNDGDLYVSSNETGFIPDFDEGSVENENDFFLNESESTFDIHLNSHGLAYSSALSFKIELELEKEELVNGGIEYLKIRFFYEYFSESNQGIFYLVGGNSDIPLEGLMRSDVDIEIDQPSQGFSEAEVEFSIRVNEKDLIINKNSFLFLFNGNNYTFSEFSNIPDVTVSLSTTASIQDDIIYINQGNYEDITIVITAPTGSLVEVKKFDWSNSQESSNFTLDTLVQM